MSDIFLSVVVPAYNEEKNIPEALKKISAYLSLKNYPWEVLVSNDGSKDDTGRVVQQYADAHPNQSIRLLNFNPNHGKGFASRQGMLAANGRYVLLTDADMSSPIKEVDKLIEALEKGHEVAIGSRAIRKKGCDVQQSLKRHISGRIFNAIVQLSVLPGIQDSQCGFKLFTHDACQRLFSVQKLDGFSFDVEVLYLARKFGFKIAEVPVMWSQGEDSKVSLFRDSTRMLKEIFLIRKLHHNP